jgi:hypothetical protein
LAIILIRIHSKAGLLLHSHHHILLRYSHHHILLRHAHHHCRWLLHDSHIHHLFVVDVLLSIHVTISVRWIETTLHALSLCLYHSGWFVCLDGSGPNIVERVSLLTLEQVTTDLVLISLLLLLLSLNFKLLLLHRIKIEKAIEVVLLILLLNDLRLLKLLLLSGRLLRVEATKNIK